MFCPSCGHQLKNPDTKFCPKCGKSMPTERKTVIADDISYTAPQAPEVPICQAPETPACQTPEAPVYQAPIYQETIAPAPAYQAPIYQETIAPAPAYQAPFYQPAAPVKAPKVKKPLPPIFTKDNLITCAWYFALLLVYAGISALLILLPAMEDTIVISSASDYAYDKSFALSDLLNTMVNGNRIFHPTTASLAIGIGAYVLIFSVPAFALISFVGSIVRKKSGAFSVAFTTIAVLAAAYVAVLVPVAPKLIPELYQATALSVGAIVIDSCTMSASKLIIFSALAIALAICGVVFSVIINKRRNSK